MKDKSQRRHSSGNQTKKDKDKPNLPGYPPYPEGEDIYEKYEEESDISPEDITKTKPQNNQDTANIGEDLDVPGAELDDAMEKIGSEDEENNYYSLGATITRTLKKTSTFLKPSWIW